MQDITTLGEVVARNISSHVVEVGGDRQRLIHRVPSKRTSRVQYMCGKVRPAERWGMPSRGVSATNMHRPRCEGCEVAYLRYLVTGVETVL